MKPCKPSRKSKTLLLIAALLIATQAFATRATVKPNILLIVLDDAGYSDVAGFGRNDAPTPNLKHIADEGVRFTRHYADSTCKPARLALMTGRTSATVAQAPDFRGISPQVTTLAEALKQNGYSTHHVGKWHLGDSVRDSWPDKQGFDDWFGFLNQFQLKGPDKNGQFTKRPTYLNPWLQSNDTPLKQYQGHLEDILADNVIAKIQSLAQQNKNPWFINYWLFAPHHPSQASAEFLAKFDVTPQGKYLALLAQADAEIGRVLQTLHDTQQLDNTLIVVVSDNGGTNDMMNNNAPFAGVKGGYQEGSLRTPLIIRWPDKRHASETRNDIVAIQDIYPTLLAAIGSSTPNVIDGQDLHPLLDNKTLTPRVLTHEMVNVGAFHYSVLTADGNWRLSDGALYDLEHDAASAVDAANTFPERQTALQTRYQKWRAQKTRINLTYTPLHANGRAVVSGDDFRRSPGYGAFSFTVDIELPIQKLADPIYIAEQQNVWSLRYNPDTSFTLQMGAQTINSEKLSDASLQDAQNNHTLSLTLSSTFTRSRLHEGHNTGYIHLHTNTEKLLDWKQDNPPEITTGFSNPTYIGQRSDGSSQWPGHISAPGFWNDDLGDGTSTPPPEPAKNASGSDE